MTERIDVKVPNAPPNIPTDIIRKFFSKRSLDADRITRHSIKGGKTFDRLDIIIRSGFHNLTKKSITVS